MHHADASRSSRGEFAWRLDAAAGSISEARHAFESWLRELVPVDDDVHDMTVVLSELASNAASGAAEGTAPEIRAHVAGDDLHLEVLNRVHDDASGVARWDLDDPLRGGGRGLLIVRAYTDSLEIDTVDGAVRVRCVRRLDPPS